MKNWKILAITLTVLALPLAASAGGVDFSVGAWYVNPDGDIAYSDEGPARRLDLDGAGYDDEWEFLVRLKAQPPKLPGIYLQAAPLSFDSSGDSFEFSLGDTVFNPGDTIDSEFFLNVYDAALYLPIPLLKQGTLGVVSAEIGAGARWIHLRAELPGVSTGDGDNLDELIDGDLLEDSQTANAVYPVGYAALHIRPHDRISLEGEVWGYSWNSDKFWTLVARLKLRVIGPLYVDGGYREDYYNFDDEDLSINDAHFKGPFAEVGFQW